LVTCNGAFGCPCQSNALPTKGHCRAGAGYQVLSDRFGDTDLAGVRFAGLFGWPGPIHEGDGEAMLIVDEKVSAAQWAAIKAHIGMPTGGFIVRRLVEGAIEPIRNPATGGPHRAWLTLPADFEY
jgi:hypothetical protein